MPRTRVQQYSGPKDLLDRLSRDLQRLQEAPSPAAALDAAITYCAMAWSLVGWLYAPITGTRRRGVLSRALLIAG